MNIQLLTKEDIQELRNKLDLILSILTNDADKSNDTLEVKQAAKLLTVSEKTVRGYIHSGKLEAVDFNKGTGKRPVWKVCSKAITKFLDSKRV